MNNEYPSAGPLGAVNEWHPVGDDWLGVRALYPDFTSESDLAMAVLSGAAQGRASW